jgi:hypothetical protein
MHVSRLAIVAVFIGLIGLPDLTFACSSAMCINDGPEFRGSFVVSVIHYHTPVSGVNIKIRPDDPKSDVLSLQTDSAGQARLSNLPPGTYWMETDLLAVKTNAQCFHVKENPSKEALAQLELDWGDSSRAVKHPTGRVVDNAPSASRPGSSNPRPLRARLTLNRPDGAVYEIKTDDEGRFQFGEVPRGTFVLKIQPYDLERVEVDDLLLWIGPEARLNTMLLKRGPVICGSRIWELAHDSRH